MPAAPAQHGYVENASAVTGIGTSFAVGKAIKLDNSVSGSTALPLGAYWSHVEITMTKASGSPATVQVLFTWDSAGDEPASGISSTVDLQAGVTTTTKLLCAVGMDVWPKRPYGRGEHGAVYMFLKVDSGTVDLTTARLHWRDHLGG